MARTPAKKSSAKKTPAKKSAAKPKRSSKTAPAAKKKTARRKTAKKPAAKKSIVRSTKTKTAKAPSSKAKVAKAKASKPKAVAKPKAKPVAKASAKKLRRKSEEITMERRNDGPRRDDGATMLEPVVVNGTTLERREKVTRRRQIDPTTCERDYSENEVEFMNAMDEYKRKNGRMFPTCSEVLEVIRDLGYVQLSPAEIAVRKADEVPVGVSTEGDFDSQVEAEANEALEMSDELRAEAFDEID